MVVKLAGVWGRNRIGKDQIWAWDTQVTIRVEMFKQAIVIQLEKLALELYM